MSGPARFASTIWTQLRSARAGKSRAYFELVGQYRPALVAWIRGQGFSRADAEDLAQEVLLSLVKDRLLDRADPDKGRFRSLLLAVCRNRILNELRRRRAQRRGGAARTVPLDEVDDIAVSEEDDEFDQCWARELLRRAIAGLEAEHPNYYAALSASLEGCSQAEIARRLDATVAQVNNHLHRARGFIRRHVRQAVADTCATQGDFRREWRHLSPLIDAEESGPE